MTGGLNNLEVSMCACVCMSTFIRITVAHVHVLGMRALRKREVHDFCELNYLSVSMYVCVSD